MLINCLRLQFTIVCNELVFVPDRPLQLCLLFAAKAGAYPSEALMFSVGIGPSTSFRSAGLYSVAVLDM